MVIYLNYLNKSVSRVSDYDDACAKWWLLIYPFQEHLKIIDKILRIFKYNLYKTIKMHINYLTNQVYDSEIFFFYTFKKKILNPVYDSEIFFSTF